MVNKVFLIGRVGRDPDIRVAPSGTVVANFSIATDRNRKDKDGNWLQETEWHRIVAFGRLGETARDRIKKGRLVFIEGHIHYNTWEDKEGVKRYNTDIIAERLRFLDKPSQSEEYGGGDVQPDTNVPPVDTSVTDDDVPF